MEDEETREWIRRVEALTFDNYGSSEIRGVILELLIQIKQGSRGAIRQLEARAREFGHHLLFYNTGFLADGSTSLSPEERHNLQQALDAVLPLLGDVVRAHIRPVIDIITPQLTSADPIENETARNIVSSLSNSVGLQFMVDLGTADVLGNDEHCRLRSVQVFAALASSWGIASVLPILDFICSSSNPDGVRDTGFKIAQQIAVLSGQAAVVPHLGALVQIVSRVMSNESNALTVRTAALAIDALALAAHPYGAEHFGQALGMAFRCVGIHSGRRWMKSAAACAKAIGSILGLMEEPAKSYYFTEVMAVVSCAFPPESLDDETRGEVMAIYKQCFCAEGVTDQNVIRWLDKECVFKSFWAKIKELGLQDCRSLLDVTMKAAKKIGVEATLERVGKEINGASHGQMQQMMQIVTKAVACSGSGASGGHEEFEGLVLEMHRLFTSPSS